MIQSNLSPYAVAMSHARLQVRYHSRQIAKLEAVSNLLDALEAAYPRYSVESVRAAYTAVQQLVLPQEVPEYDCLAQALSQARKILF